MSLLGKGLRRYRVVFRSSDEARNFHDAIGYVYRKEPVEGRDIPRVMDGRTVIIYAFPYYWTRASLQRQARIRGGRVASSGSVYR